MQGRLRLLRIFAIVLATAIACSAILYFSIPMNDTQQGQFDVILVLGNPAKSDGSIGPLARARVLEWDSSVPRGRRAASAHERGRSPEPVCRGPGDAAVCPFSGCTPSVVFAEGQSQNTIQNAYYSYKIMQAHDWTSALIVSSPTHLRRASLIFRNYPLEWRMDEAPWPQDYPLWKRVWNWFSEIGYTSYGRIFGFPNARQYLPHTHFTLPRF